MRFSLTIFFCLSFTAPLNARQAPELRGVWITNVASTVMDSDSSIAEAMDALAGMGFNVIFPVVWNGGYTLYPSTVMRTMTGAGVHPHFMGRDPLERIVIEAHRNGMEVIPWFEYGFAANWAVDSSDLGPVLLRHPSWTLRNAAGTVATKNGRYPQFVWMSAINREAQDFIISLVTEVIDRYDVDGVQGDDRLPAMPNEGGYEASTTAEYARTHAGAMPPGDGTDAAWTRWRADRLNAFLARLRDSVKARGNEIVFSSGPSEYAWGYPQYLQDSKTWVDSALIDNFIPQLYPTNRSTPDSTLAEYAFRLDRALAIVPSMRRSMTFAGVLARVGSYTVEPSTLTAIVALNRSRGIHGETFFFYEALRANGNVLGDTLGRGVYRRSAPPPFRNGEQWRPRGIIVHAIDSSSGRTGKWHPAHADGPGDVLVSTESEGVNGLDYVASVPADGWYDVYAYHRAGPVHVTAAAIELLPTGGGPIRVIPDTGGNLPVGWNRMGTIFLHRGRRHVARIPSQSASATRPIAADAVMLLLNRKRSPEAVVKPIGPSDSLPLPARLHPRQGTPQSPSSLPLNHEPF